MTAATKTITLLNYNNEINPVTYLWICGVGCPAGQDFNHRPDDDDDFCNVDEIIDDLGLWELEGEVVNGRWEWNGEGNPTDERGNTIYNVKAF